MDFYDGIREVVQLIITQRGLHKVSREELVLFISEDLNDRMVTDMMNLIYNNFSDENKTIYLNLLKENKIYESGLFAMNNCPELSKFFKDVTSEYIKLYKK